jgi:hypothetical protein
MQSSRMVRSSFHIQHLVLGRRRIQISECTRCCAIHHDVVMNTVMRTESWLYVAAPGLTHQAHMRDQVTDWCTQNVTLLLKNRIQGESWLLGHNCVWFAEAHAAEEFQVWFTCTYG